MQGARWGWVAFVAAIAVLFVASSQDQTSQNKVANLLRQELKNTNADREELQAEHQQTLASLETMSSWALTVDQQYTQSQQELRAMKAERDKLKKELASLNSDRSQLQQTVASLQLERSQTKRSVEQLRQGLHQLLNQTDNVTAQLAAPAPGVAQTTFEEVSLMTPAPEKQPVKQPAKQPVKQPVKLPAKKPAPTTAPATGEYFADEPLNENQ